MSTSTQPAAPPAPPLAPPRAFLFSVALVAASILLFEIALTRVFGTVLRYHLTFLSISIALCGLGVGGFTVHLIRRRRVISLASLGVSYALATILALLVLLRGVLAFYPELYWMSALVVLVPFSLGGAWLAEAFARFPTFAGRLYAWDLAGASIAALLAVPILNLFPAPTAVVAAAVLGAAGGVVHVTRERWVVPAALSIVLLLLGASGGKRVKELLDVPALPPKPDQFGMTLANRGVTQDLFTELGTPGNKSRIVETRHNAFARTDVVEDPVLPDGYFLYTNGNVPTSMMRWDERLSSLPSIAADYRLSDWCFASARLKRPNTNVFSIGPGGGLDALLALHHRAGKFDGAEINPSILDIMEARAAMNGRIYQKANVRVQIADGRAFARQAIARGEKYNLIFSALTKTATAGQGLALLESFIHTREAFRDYWRLLKPDGQATLVLDNQFITARFVATWLQVLGDVGINEKDAMRHIAITVDPQPGPYVFAIVVQKSAFSPAQSRQLYEQANLRGLNGVWISNYAASPNYGPYTDIGSGELSLSQFVNQYRSGRDANGRPLATTGGQPLDISPCPDDRPFVLDLSIGAPPGMQQLVGFSAILCVAMAAVGLLSVRTPQVLEARAERELDAEDVLEAPQVLGVGAAPPQTAPQVLEARLSLLDGAWVAYFFALGVGFMMVEIPLSQLLILPLGYPTLALSVILFAVLLGGGIGSWASQQLEGPKLARYAMICALCVSLLALAFPFLIRALSNVLPLWPMTARAAAVAGLLLPLGFVLGTPFPSGMRLFAQRRPTAIPLIWGLNGVASVVGSLCAAIGAKALGFSQTLVIGASIYVLAALAVWWLGSGNNAEAAVEN